MSENNNRSQQSAWSLALGFTRILLTPILILAAFAGGIAMLGMAQQNSWIQSALSDQQDDQVLATATATTYICPMMCVPPTTQPGRCPVCGMELVPAAGASAGPSSTIQIDPRSRRVAGIQTVTATTQTLRREIAGVGEIVFDESNMKNLSAYIDGRIEELYADYTGIEVEQGQTLALLYSPDLYSAQVEYVKTLEYADINQAANNRVAEANENLLASSRRRLIEMGLTDAQVKEIERTKSAQRRFELKAPISGTVIQKFAVKGQYVTAGTPIYQLADLRKVWLVLELFPEDAGSIRLGQPVIASTQSLNSESVAGKVDFISPSVDPKTRTVGVRVVIENEEGKLRPGEFARAKLQVDLLTDDGMGQATVVVPRDSLLSVGNTSVAYVEIQPGEFQLRQVKTGPTVDRMTAILQGINAGDQVVARSTFLLDAQMQLQGNPSLIDPNKAVTIAAEDLPLTEAELEEMRVAFAPLSDSERAVAQEQVICPVTEVRLGSTGMGTPIQVDVNGKGVMICCEGCRSGLLKEPDKYLKILLDYKSNDKEIQPKVEDDLPQLDLPQTDLPQTDLPQTDLPQMALPQMALPQLDLPQLDLPQMDLPK